jgi:hypothetical protein
MKFLKKYGNRKFYSFEIFCSVQPYEIFHKTSSNLSFEFCFKTKIVSLEGILIQLNSKNYLKQWTFEASAENQQWTLLFEAQNQQCESLHQRFYLKVQNSDPFCSFKLSILVTTSTKQSVLFVEQLELFGHIIDPLNSI